MPARLDQAEVERRLRIVHNSTNLREAAKEIGIATNTLGRFLDSQGVGKCANHALRRVMIRRVLGVSAKDSVEETWEKRGWD